MLIAEPAVGQKVITNRPCALCRRVRRSHPAQRAHAVYWTGHAWVCEVCCFGEPEPERYPVTIEQTGRHRLAFTVAGLVTGQGECLTCGAVTTMRRWHREPCRGGAR